MGPFKYVRSFGSKPTSFVLTRDDGRQYQYGKQTWRWALEAVQHLGGVATRPQIESYIAQRVSGFKLSNVGPDLSLISVNDYGRSNWTMNQSPRRTDGWNPYDALYRRDSASGAVYELYEPAKHGVWELAPDAEGVVRPVLTGESSEIVQALVEAEAAKVFDAADDTDGRKKVLASIVQRRGQPKFRRELVKAYDGRCAVTGCTVVEILEGAHIKPYMGEHTNHVSNGLLLRADIHTLFDLRLLRVHPDSLAVEIAPRAQAGYSELQGRPLLVPSDQAARPDHDALHQHFDACQQEWLT